MFSYLIHKNSVEFLYITRRTSAEKSLDQMQLMNITKLFFKNVNSADSEEEHTKLKFTLKRIKIFHF